MLVLAVVGGGLYGGYRWTQTQYYVGTKDDHVALFQGINQDLAWVSLSKVHRDHPEIELKYLPPYQRKQVEATIAEGGMDEAREKVEELGVQASACKKDAERRAAAQKQQEEAKPGKGDSDAAGDLTDDAKSKNKSDATPTPGPSLSEEEQKLVPLCGKQ